MAGQRPHLLIESHRHIITQQDDLFISHVLGGLSWVLESNTTRAMNSSALVGNSETFNSSPATTAGAEATTTPAS
jgi:hypothetical protein